MKKNFCQQKEKNLKQKKPTSSQQNIDNSAKKNLKQQKNKTKLRRKAEFVFKIREFIRILPYHILVMGSVFAVAAIFGKYLEAVCFLAAFFSLRYKFDTTYHSNSIVICMCLTITIFTLSIVICPPIYTYMFFSILFAYVDCLCLWFIQDWLNKKADNKMLNYQIYELICQLKQYKNIDLYKMSEEELRQYAQSKGLSEPICDTLVLKIIHNYRWVDIQKERKYSKDGIRYHKEQIIAKLEVDL